VKIVTADDFLSRNYIKINDVYSFNQGRFWFAPTYMALLQSKIATVKLYTKFIPAVLDSQLDYWQLPQPLPGSEYRSSNALFFLRGLLDDNDSVSVLYKHHTIAMIRAARVAVRHAAGLETDSIRDPFMDAPFQIFEGDFVVKASVFEGEESVKIEQKVCGIRISSEGYEQLEKTDNRPSHLYFDIVFEKAENPE